MLLKCIRRLGVVGQTTFKDADITSEAIQLYSTTLGRLYRPLSLSVRAKADGTLEQFVLILSDLSCPEKPSLHYVQLLCFELVEPSIPSGWRVLHQSDKLLHIGDPLTSNIENLMSEIERSNKEIISKLQELTSQ